MLLRCILEIVPKLLYLQHGYKYTASYYLIGPIC